MKVGDKVTGKVAKVRDDGLVVKLKDNNKDVFAFLHISRVSPEIAHHFNDYFRVNDQVTAYIYQYNSILGKCMLTTDADAIKKQQEERKALLTEDFTTLEKKIPQWIEKARRRR